MSSGRKRKSGVKRVNGRISQRKGDVSQRRAETEQSITETARLARMRVFGIKAEDAMNPDTASVIGRLKRAKVINVGQYNAAIRYEACVMSYRAAILCPPQPGGQDLGAVRGGSSTTDYDDRYARSVERYNLASAAINAENSLHRGENFGAALDAIVMRDQDMPHLYGSLRLGLNALAHHFKCVEEDREKAA